MMHIPPLLSCLVALMLPLLVESAGNAATVVLFPWFSEVMGVIAFLLLSRYCRWLPFTAVMFLIGTIMGIVVTLSDDEVQDEIALSTTKWIKIDGHVLLLVFLPGLLFKDAFEVNAHLFKQSIWQLLIMAFPGVLAGTTLVALVGYYVFPYQWSWPLCMTMGSILAATDPVAVSVLLNEVGAPPRLKMHVSGESLLNDGSAVVFFTIFSNMFLFELGIEGLGEDISVGQGFALFFQMAVGGALIGIAFGLGLMGMLYVLNRRLDHHENIVQVAMVISMAYLSFYVAEFVAHCSGVISVVICGITTQAFGSNMINDHHTMEAFVEIVEYMLNVLLFTLAGAVFGSSIVFTGSNSFFGAEDWGYLFVLWALLNVIRAFLVFSFYPILVRLGLKTNRAEAIFLSFGGLRGAVGIALALALEAEVFAKTDESDSSQDFVRTLFCHVGGISFLTLVINGTLAAPLIKKLGLAESTSTRKLIVNYFYQSAKDRTIRRFVKLLADPRFRELDVSIVIQHVPALKELTWRELKLAVDEDKAEARPESYRPPNLCRVLPYLLRKSQQQGEQVDVDKEYMTEPPKRSSNVDFEDLHQIYDHQYRHSDLTTLMISAAAAGDVGQVENLLQEPGTEIDKGDYDYRTPMHLASSNGHVDVVMLLINRGANVNVEDRWGGRPLDDAIKNNNAAVDILKQHGAVCGGQQVHKVDETTSDRPGLGRSLNTKDLAGVKENTVEIRQIFIETLRQAYAHQVKLGELDGRGMLDNILLGSLDQASAKVSRGQRLDDWKILSRSTPWSVYAENLVNELHAFGTRNRKQKSKSSSKQEFGAGLDFKVKVALAYISAHAFAQHLFKVEFASTEYGFGEFAAAKERVLEESKDGVKRAKDFLDAQDPAVVSVIVSRMACVILLNSAARYMESLATAGLLKQKEATHYIEECDHALVELRGHVKSMHGNEEPPAKSEGDEEELEVFTA